MLSNIIKSQKGRAINMRKSVNAMSAYQKVARQAAMPFAAQAPKRHFS